MLVAAIGMPDGEMRSLLAEVEGEPRGLEELGAESEAARNGGARDRLKKMYKITEEELAVSSLEGCIVMRMAVKDH